MDNDQPNETHSMQQGIGKPAYVHTLSLRLTDKGYRRLRHFVVEQEDRLGHRLTHQAVLESALYHFLDTQEGIKRSVLGDLKPAGTTGQAEQR